MTTRHFIAVCIGVLGGCFMLVASLSAAESARAIVRASLDPTDDIVVGQKVQLKIDVLGRDGWAQISNLPDIEVAGAQVLRTETQGTRVQETVQGGSYTGQQYEMLVYPRREGTLTIPQTPVEVTISQWGAGAASVSELAQIPKLEFQAILPPGAESARGLISTTDFNAVQNWAPTTKEFLVGATLKRTLRFEAADVPGMLIPPLEEPAIASVAIYPAQPELNDAADRGELTGRRTNSVTYLFQQPGSVTLPEVSVSWWDLKNRELKRETLPGLVLTVKPNPAAAAAAGRARGNRSQVLPAALFLSITIGLIAVWFSRRKLLEGYRTWKLRLQESEGAYFERFLRAAETNDPRLALRHLMQWLDRIHTGSGVPRLDLFVARFGTEDAQKAVDGLLKANEVNAPGDWQGTQFRQTITEVRRKWIKERGGKRLESSPLPSLNPTVDASVIPR